MNVSFFKLLSSKSKKATTKETYRPSNEFTDNNKISNKISNKIYEFQNTYSYIQKHIYAKNLTHAYTQTPIYPHTQTTHTQINTQTNAHTKKDTYTYIHKNIAPDQ